MRSLEVFKGLDWFLIVTLALIQVFGLVAVFSALKSEENLTLFKKHILYVVLGWVVLFLLSREKFRNLVDLSLYIYLFNLFLLVLVLVVGKEVSGARRWLSLGFITIQPSEFMKLSLILISACLLPLIKGLRDRKVLLLFLAFAIPVVVTFQQPDLGTAVAYAVPLLAIVFARGVPVKYLVAVCLLAVASLPFLWDLLKDYQKRRILAVLDPYSDYLGSGYQLIQSVIAIGSGGLTGKGLTKGTQTQLLFLPEVHTDFIFSLIGEEMGFLGSFALVVLIFLFLYRILSYTKFTLTMSETLFVVGTFSLFSFQYGVNILMTLGMFPVVGIPLPFVSFGGSSFVTFSALVGILLSIYRDYRTSVPLLRGK
ncbi:MAG: rod shape-determining protein RodA [Aquificota bacterium]|nr:rod shape-determining protein RodA [Aquificota bacterium]